MKKLLTTAMVMVLGGLSAGYAAPVASGNVDLSITVADHCVITPVIGATLTEPSYNWTNVADVVLSDSYPDMVECNQGAPAPTGTATSASVGNPGFHAAMNGLHFLDYTITQDQIGAVSAGSGEGTLATGDKYPFDLEVTIPAGQKVVAGNYTDTITINIDALP